MSFRTTGLSNFMLFQRALSKSNAGLFKASEQLASTKKINRPSDDPEGAKVVLSYKDTLDNIDQYQNNLLVADRTLKQTETSLSSAKDILIRAKELAIQGRNGTLSTEARTALAKEVQQMQQQMLSLSNTQINGEYIFAGYKSDTKPFSLDNNQPNADPVATFAGSSSIRSVVVGENTTLQIQVDGNAAFMGDGTASTVDIFQTMSDLEVALRTGNLDDSDPKSVGQMIDDLEVGSQQILGQITTVGANSNRIEMTQQHLLSQKETLKEFISTLEDTDISEVAFEYQRTNTILQATIQAAGNIMNMPSLMSFIGR